MPTAIGNAGISTSEERLPVNGSFSSGSPVDEPRIFVFVEKNPGESLGLYLVPFEEEVLTGLYVKTVVSGKSAARLQVFDPGDKIVSVNGKSLSGLTYRESTDFIRQCPGPNVKMGIIKHALYKKEDLAKLDSMSVFQRHSAADVEIESPDIDLGGSASFGLGAHTAAGRLSGNVPKVSVDGSGGASKELVIEAPLMVAKPEVSYQVESTPDFSMDFDGLGGKSDNNIDLSGGLSTKGAGADIDTNANLAGNNGGDMDIDFTAPDGIFGDASVSAPGASGTTEDMDSDSSVENRPPENRRPKLSKGCRRSRSNPQIRPRHLAELVVDRRSGIQSRNSPDQSRSPGRGYAISGDYYSPSTVFRAGNPCAMAAPLSQRSPDSRSYMSSYLVPLSDQPSSYWMQGNAGMIKSKSLDKLDEIMRNDPILRDDYLGVSPSSKSTQTQTETVYKKKRPRRKRNDRPRSQILPPTYLQLPSVTWHSNELGSNENVQGATPENEPRETRNANDCYLGPNYSRATHRRKSKEEQAQIVQRWIDEMIEHKKAQELRRQNIVRQSVGRERTTKLKKKSRSVPEHTFRGNQSKFERRRASDADSEEINREYIEDAKLRHSGSDPSFRYQMYADVSTSSVGTASTQTVGTSTGTDEKISPFLQSRIRSLEQSFQQSSTSSSSLQNNNNSLDSAKQLGRNGSESSPRALRRTRASNPDLPLINHLLSGGELDSQC